MAPPIFFSKRATLQKPGLPGSMLSGKSIGADAKRRAGAPQPRRNSQRFSVTNKWTLADRTFLACHRGLQHQPHLFHPLLTLKISK